MSLQLTLNWQVSAYKCNEEAHFRAVPPFSGTSNDLLHWVDGPIASHEQQRSLVRSQFAREIW